MHITTKRPIEDWIGLVVKEQERLCTLINCFYYEYERVRGWYPHRMYLDADEIPVVRHTDMSLYPATADVAQKIREWDLCHTFRRPQGSRSKAELFLLEPPES